MAAGDIGANLRTYLLTKTAVTDLLGTTAEIYSDQLPQRGVYTLPAIVYKVISGSAVRHLSGSSKTAVTRVQLDCWANTRPAANALREAVRTVLETYRGAAGDDTIDWSTADTSRDNSEDPKDGSENWLYSATQDYMLMHSQPAVSV